MSNEAPAETIRPSIETIRAMYLWEDFEGQGDWAEDPVHVEHDRWKHGTMTATLVFHRKSDDTFWRVSTKVPTNGEYNSLRDGDVYDSDITQVWPHTITTTEYRNSKP